MNLSARVGLTFLLSLASASLFAAPPPQDRPALDQLIVIYDPISTAPSVEDIVSAVNSQNPAHPLKLELGNPKNAAPLITLRATPVEEASYKQAPYSPGSLLQRYVVLTYPENANFDALISALKRNPRILSVEKNQYFDLSATPNDPLYYINASQASYQALRLPEAWDYVKGNAYLSTVDNGIQLGHPDLDDLNYYYVYRNYRPQFSKNFVSSGANVDEFSNPVSTTDFPYAGHGTHVAGIMAAETNDGEGVAGTCWKCSLMLGKAGVARTGTALNGSPTYGIPLSAAVDALTWLVRGGAQVVNMSFGSTGGNQSCTNPDYTAYCNAIAFAQITETTLVAASGNFRSGGAVDFPAADSRVIAVGAVTNDPNVLWTGSSYGSAQDLVAPGQNIMSSVYTGRDWIPASCGDNSPNGSYPGYGNCTGTSMAAPYVSGIAGLVRSANPLLSKDNVYQILTASASRAFSWSAQYGYGVPNAGASVRAALGIVAYGRQLTNRVAPLFSLYGNTGQDYFYTTVPQMAAGAIFATMQPQPTNAYSTTYQPVGPLTPGYVNFPIDAYSQLFFKPRASVYILTTESNMTGSYTWLVPLYRMSYVNNYTGNQDHTYTTEPAGIESFKSVGYKLDGIEGYIYSKSGIQPYGTVRLMRKYNSSRDDHAIFPESELNTMIAQGYTQNSGNTDWIGYVYPNSDLDGDGLIDGFESLVGTCGFRADTDYDGRTDGQEVNQYPYTDPGRCY